MGRAPGRIEPDHEPGFGGELSDQLREVVQGIDPCLATGDDRVYQQLATHVRQ